MELCSILSDINAPNATYKKIITWAQKIKTGDLLSPISRKVLLKRLAKSEGMIGNDQHGACHEQAQRRPNGRTQDVFSK